MEIKNKELSDYGYLVRLAIVSDTDIDRVVSEWQDNPPEEEFTNILVAEDWETRGQGDGGTGRRNNSQLPTPNSQLKDDYNLPDFYFDKSLQRYRYRDSGKFVPKQAVENLTRKSIAQVKKDILNTTELLIGNKISLATWEQTTAEGLKKLHSWQYLLGKGGAKNMTQSDNGRLGLRLSYEYGYLRSFAQDIAEGKISEAQLLARVDLYLNSSNGSFNEATRSNHRESGYNWEKRVRTKQESCQSCLMYAAMGWQRIGTLPQPTQKCECRANCGCRFVFSKELNKPQDMLSKKWGWSA